MGASGATGKLLVEQLLNKGQHIKIIVRPTAKIPQDWYNSDNISIVKSNINEITVHEMAGHLKDCKAVTCGLGHNLNLNGIYGKPRNLVTDAVRLVCEAHSKYNSPHPLKFVLMNTVGNSNRNLKEPISFGQRIMIALIRILLPPHRDNEKASDYLRLKIGQQHPYIHWTVVRPDTLFDEDTVTSYSLNTSPIRSAVFNPGQTSRINVANFMANLVVNDDLWNTWQGQMPVIYNTM